MSDSVRPHRRQPTRLHRPWDSPGKNTGVACHFLLQCMKVKSESEVSQSCLTLRDAMDCSLPGSSIHGIGQEYWSGVHCLLRLNSPSFCLSVKLSICLSNLNESLAGNHHLGCRFFPFATFPATPFSLLPCCSLLAWLPACLFILLLQLSCLFIPCGVFFFSVFVLFISVYLSFRFSRSLNISCIFSIHASILFLSFWIIFTSITLNSF